MLGGKGAAALVTNGARAGKLFLFGYDADRGQTEGPRLQLFVEPAFEVVVEGSGL